MLGVQEEPALTRLVVLRLRARSLIGFGDRCVLSLQKGSNMNALQSYYGDEEFDYRGSDRSPESRTQSRPSQSRRAQNDARRRGKAPSQHNGIHRRRKKRITW